MMVALQYVDQIDFVKHQLFDSHGQHEFKSKEDCYIIRRNKTIKDK